MKKLLRNAALIAVMLVVAFAGTTNVSCADTQHSGKCGNKLVWKLDSNGKLTISGTGTMYNYKLTSDFKSTAPWTEYSDEIVKLVIKKGLTTIGSNAFCDLQLLRGSISIPNGVKSIGKGAFSNCWDITGSLKIPDSVKSIGEDAFSCCFDLNGTLTIGKNVTAIGKSAFLGCSFKKLILGKSVKTIKSSAFYGCDFKGKLTLPKGVKTIGDFAFHECKNFTGTLKIPDGVKTIGMDAFRDCSGFTGTLTIPKSVTFIDETAFRDCKGINKIVFKGNYAKYDETAFWGIDAFSPKKTVIENIEVDSGTIKLSWNKQTENTDGYFVRVSGNSWFLYLVDAVDIDNNDENSCIIEDLEPGTYYVDVNAYRNIGGKKFTGELSDAMKVEVK